MVILAWERNDSLSFAAAHGQFSEQEGGTVLLGPLGDLLALHVSLLLVLSFTREVEVLVFVPGCSLIHVIALTVFEGRLG